jgi:3-oxoacyl-[acyl-carrier protein] reductase
MSDSQSSSTRHVVITGGAGGIGAGIGRVFARGGDAVTLVDYRADALVSVAADIRTAVPGAVVRWLVADLTSGTEPGAVVDRAWAEGGPVDVLVNGAGLYPSTPLLELDATIWDAILDVNLRAAVLTTVAFGRAAVAAGRTGSVVNITSGAALRAREAAAPYSTSKAALEQFTRASALELGRHGIRVNAVSPGFVAVASPVNPYLDAYKDAADNHPLERAGTPEDIGEAVYWITGEKADWVTGTILRVDGGSSTGNAGLPRSWPQMSLGIKGDVDV